MGQHSTTVESRPTGTVEQAAFQGVVSVFEIYAIDEAKRRLGWSDSALRNAKRRGLQLLTSGKRRYVTGNEILRFLQSNSGQKSPVEKGH